MLDTNVASDVIRSTIADQRLVRIPMQLLGISTITEAELLYGLAKKPLATKLRELVHAFLRHVDILAWDSEAARSYAELRALSEAKGITLDDPDMFIAAHAHAAGRTLITRDAALIRLKPWMRVESWSAQ
jgi:tRNA(fMet)-specific endonuclease VapC